MPNGAELCCILGVCCPPLAEKRLKLLTDHFVAGGMAPEAAAQAAEIASQKFTLTNYLRAIQSHCEHHREG